MAWNQPGGDNNNRDPWGNRNDQQQGPPDLDEVLKKFQGQLGRLFKGKGGGGGDGSGGFGGGAGGIGKLGIAVILVIAVVVWAIAGIYIVDPAEEAVVKRFGAYVRTEGPGPHWAPPFIETYQKVNVRELNSETIGYEPAGNTRRKVPKESLMLTADENIVDLEFAIQYRVQNAADFLFQVRAPVVTLQLATESAIREVVGRSTMDFVLTEGREAVATEVERIAQEILDRYQTGLMITSVNMQNAQPPQQVQEAFLDAIKAREDQERIINEAKAYRATIVPTAEGQARGIKERSNAYKESTIAQAQGETNRFLNVLSEYKKAPAVTRERMYIESVEHVMSNTSKVLMDLKGSNNLMMLPLDQMLKGGARSDARNRVGARSTMRDDDRSSASNEVSSSDILRGRGRGR
ncbi:MAG: FtsH protease activity modulator HflK [Gammaproteobacteria bacterium]|nr:FtsH protease activity modulator HflK [Gammaproteobacteria bacterium]